MWHDRNQTSALRLIAVFFAVFCLLIPCTQALGQSGRKQKRTESQPPVQGVNQPDARVAPEPDAAPEKPKEAEPAVLVASDMGDFNMPSYLVDIARQGCVVEMREAHLSDVREAKNQNRVDAIKTAKDDGIYVVLLELRIDEFGSSSSGRYQFDLRYTIFEAKTGKIINTGAGYPAQTQARIPAPSSGYGYEQRQVELMGRDAGRKVVKVMRERPGRTPVT